MNNTSSHLQMPVQVDVKPSPGGKAASAATGDSTAKGANGGFAQAMRVLQMPSKEGAKASSGQNGKDRNVSSTHSTKKQDSNGNDLPLTAVLLPLLQQIHAVSPAQPSGATAKAETNLPSGGLSQASPAQLRQLMQLLGGQAGTSPAGGDLKAWLNALVQASHGTLSAHAGGESAAPSNVSISAALAVHTAAAGAAGNTQPPQQTQQTAATQAPLSLTNPGFANALGDRVSWLAGSAGTHTAQLQLHPSGLGPMLVQVKVDGHQTEVLFQTQNAVVMNTLEAALPRLREMLAQGGQQVSVNIQQQTGGWSGQSGQGQQQTPQWASPMVWSGSTPLDGEPSNLHSPLSRWYNLQNGMIDTYV